MSAARCFWVTVVGADFAPALAAGFIPMVVSLSSVGESVPGKNHDRSIKTRPISRNARLLRCFCESGHHKTHWGYLREGSEMPAGWAFPRTRSRATMARQGHFE